MLLEAMVGWFVGVVGDVAISKLRRSPEEKALRAALGTAIDGVLDLAEPSSRELLRRGLVMCFGRPPELRLDRSAPPRAALRRSIGAQLATMRQMASEDGVLFFDLAPEERLVADLSEAFEGGLRAVVAASSPDEYVRMLDQEDLREAIRRLRDEIHASRGPSPIVTADWYREKLSTIPGFEADLHGARDAISAVRDWTRGSGPRVLVIEAPGGIGKTRIVLEGLAPEALVLQPGASLTEMNAGAVPAETPMVLFLDDVHKAPELSGLVALLADPRFQSVRMALTTRPGLVGAVLAQIGVSSDSVQFIPLTRLGREDVDAIVTGYGIQNPEFRAFVIGLAEGNPLIAHTAADVAAGRGVFAQESLDQVMEHYLRSRLEPANDRYLNDGHLAVAVAIALLTSATAEDVLQLEGIVSGIPGTLAEVRAVMNDLADRGIVSGTPFVFRPDRAAPALVRMALYPQTPHGTGLAARRLKVSCALEVLLDQSSGPSALLATQLGVLAHAASSVDGDLAAVVRAVESLVPARQVVLADPAGYWVDLFAIAGAVGRFEPSLLDRLVNELAHSWPLGSAHAEYPYAATDRDVVRAAADSARTVAREGDDALGYAVLSLIRLSSVMPTSGKETPDPPCEALVELADFTGHPSEAVRARRTILRLLNQQWAAAPVGSEVCEWLAHLVLRCLPALTAPTVEHRQFGTVSSALELTIRTSSLPVDEITSEVFSLSADLAVSVLDQPPPPAIAASAIECMREMRRKGRIGFPSGRSSLSDRLREHLDEAADRLEDQLSTHWATLSLSTRYQAVSGILELPRRGTEQTLEAQRSAGSAIAAAALVDNAVLAFITIFPPRPIDDPLTADQRLTAEAAELAEHIDIGDAFALLEDPACAERIGHWPQGPLLAFARGLGRRMGSEEALRRTIARLDAAAPGKSCRRKPSGCRTLRWARFKAPAMPTPGPSGFTTPMVRQGSPS